MKLHAIFHHRFVENRIATQAQWQQVVKQEILMVSKAFQSQFGQPSPLWLISAFLGRTPQDEIGVIEAVAQIIAFLAYLDSHLGHLKASLISVAAARLACAILTGSILVADSDIKLAQQSLDARLPIQDKKFFVEAKFVQERL